MLKILKFLFIDKKRILLVTFLLLISTAASLVLPTIMSAIVDKGINGADMGFIWKASLIMLAVAFAGLAAMMVSVKIAAAVTAKFSNAIRSAVFKKVNTLPFKRLNEIGTGALITRSTEDIWMIEQVAYYVMRGSITIPVLIIGGTVLALLKDVWLALIMFSSIPILVIVLIIITKRIKPLWDVADAYIDKQNSIIRERLTGIRVIRAFNREDKERARANNATKIMAVNIIKNNTHMGLINPLSMFLLNLAIVFIIFVGAKIMQNPQKTLSAGDIIAIIQYITLVMSGIIAMSFAIALLPHIRVNCSRINEVLDSDSLPEANDLDGAPFEGNIRFEKVNFSYEGAQEATISELDFEINKGEKIAFIGGTGAGKSTIIQILMGFLPLTGGEIYFDGNAMSGMSAQRVRHNISCVLQKATLFEGTIASNIKMANEKATDEDMYEAAEIAQIEDFITELKEGYNYPIQPAGTNLSGGQKQRISIARALLKDAPIYVFDDSFSALDFLTEAKIRAKLTQRLQAKTQIYITQRVTSAMFCDRIYVIDKGFIVASGTHKELLKNCKIYREIYLSQTGGSR
ncbi:MAG: ABC transporter ATP-binding protein [Clostridia bacterium]|nr:ABC transporter ATP-binding protein [Clostridia bacterium]